MIFYDLKLPKELSKKKKLELYKGFILPPANKGEVRELEINADSDRYSLWIESAIEYAVNQLGLEAFEGKDILSTLQKYYFIIVAITLNNGVMGEEILYSIVDGKIVSKDPNFDKDSGLLSVTIRDRFASMDILNYQLQNAEITFDANTRTISMKNIEVIKQIINKKVTG
jgi:hypothetical protein